jgi:hypothetical protein
VFTNIDLDFFWILHDSAVELCEEAKEIQVLMLVLRIRAWGDTYGRFHEVVACLIS